MNRVYPLGYSAAGSEQTIADLMERPDVLLIDTRFKPWSWRPQWREVALRENYGERYRVAGSYLGNRNYQGGPIDIVDLATGIRGLCTYLREGRDLILLCECINGETCHRKVIVEKLLEVMPEAEVIQPKQVETIMCLSIQ